MESRIMNLRLMFALLVWLTVVPFSLPSVVKADSGQAVAAGPSGSQVSTPALQPCPTPGKLTVAETSQADCCKGHKGICGCRAGKIICCDGTASSACTCHGEEGFTE
jgi:hypothetical protein